MLTNEEFIPNFLEEARVHVETVESGLLNIELEAIEPESINTIFRAVHSMKGSAGFFNLNRFVELSHSMENLLGKIRNNNMHLNSEIIDILLAANDCLKSMIEDPVASEQYDISELIAALEKLYKEETVAILPPSDHKLKAISGNADPSTSFTGNKAELIADAIRHGHSYYCLRTNLYQDLLEKEKSPLELIAVIKTIGQFIELRATYDESAGEPGDIRLHLYFTSVLEKDFLSEALDLSVEQIHGLIVEGGSEAEPQTAAENMIIEVAPANRTEIEPSTMETQDNENYKKTAIEPKAPALTAEDSLRVHVSLLNDLLNLASEMVLGRNQLLRTMEGHRKKISGIDPVLQNIDHVTSELQEKVMQTRMQPVGNVFNKFPRIMRELARKLGKEIALKLEGSEVELDKSIIEAIGDPLTHLVRNAADHGLEAPELREKLGKARRGTIIIRAYHEGGYVNIDVVDDGSGIDPDRIKSKALEKGLVNSAELAFMGDQEAFQLLFKPGFSTLDEVTDLSGRGVGMDVVKTNIEQLGGSIEVFSTLAGGSTFRLLLPLTLAIIPSLIVLVGKQRFALPQANLQEIVRIKPGQILPRIEFINNAEVLRLRGGLLPLVHLADILNLPKTYIKEAGSNNGGLEAEHIEAGVLPGLYSRDLKQVVRVLVIKIGSRRLGIVVDSIYGSEEILVKPLSAFISDCRCYSGVTIMGDGKIALILDPEGIITKANIRFSESNIKKPQLRPEDEVEDSGEIQNLLLFKCSGPETLAIDLFMVSRVEEVDGNDIERIGDREFINFRQDSMRVIRPEDFLPINKENSNSDHKQYIIIPKLVSYPIGIIAENIEDTVQMKVELNQENITGKGLVGSTIINDKIVLLLNIYELFELVDPQHYSTPKITQQGNHRILIVEDTPFFQKLEKDYLEEAGYQVLTADNGQEAWQILQETKVDAVVSDIHMPFMNGLELVKRIRADKSLAALPVMALSSLTGEMQKREGLEAGFDKYEFKLDKMRLLDVLAAILEKGRVLTE